MRIMFQLTCLILLSQSVYADQVLWSYPLDQLPPGWSVTAGEWDFEPDGAHSLAVAAAFETQWNELLSGQLVIPPGTDSISISAQQYSVTWETPAENTFSFTRMVLFINGGSNIYWNVSQNQTDSLPIFVVPPAAAGDTLTVQLLCVASSFPDPPFPPPGEPQATAGFHIWEFVVTAYGNLDLEAGTWASLKRHGHPGPNFTRQTGSH
ncbi:MAG: hypothetical protein R6V62_04130 [Candidatus Fermentibacteraceae bacterium]